MQTLAIIYAINLRVYVGLHPVQFSTHLQALRGEMQRLSAGHITARPRPEGNEPVLPPELLHVHGVSATVVDRGGAVHLRRKSLPL